MRLTVKGALTLGSALLAGCKPYTPTFADKQTVYQAETAPLHDLALAFVAVQAGDSEAASKLLAEAKPQVDAARRITDSHRLFGVSNPTADLVSLKLIPTVVADIHVSLSALTTAEPYAKPVFAESALTAFDRLYALEVALREAWSAEAAWQGGATATLSNAFVAQMIVADPDLGLLDDASIARLESVGFTVTRPAPGRAQAAGYALTTAPAAPLPPPKLRIRSSGVARSRAHLSGEPVMKVTEGELYEEGLSGNGWVQLRDAPVEAWVEESAVERLTTDDPRTGG